MIISKKDFRQINSWGIIAIAGFILINIAFANSNQIQFLNSGYGISDSIVEAHFNKENTKAILIIQHDSLTYEKKYSDIVEIQNQATPLFERLTAISLFYTSLDEGYIYSTEEPVRKYLPELPEKEFSSISLALFLNLDPGNETPAIPHIPKGLFQNLKTKDPFQVITHLYCLIVERATGTGIKEYCKKKTGRAISKMQNPIQTDVFSEKKVQDTQCGFSTTSKDWLNIAQLSIQSERINWLLIQNGNDYLFLSKSKKLIILWIGKGNYSMGIYDFVKNFSEPG